MLAATQGVDARTRKVVWNRSDNRVKLICMARKAAPVDADMPASLPTGTAGAMAQASAAALASAADNGAAFQSYSDSVKSAA